MHLGVLYLQSRVNGWERSSLCYLERDLAAYNNVYYLANWSYIVGNSMEVVTRKERKLSFFLLFLDIRALL